MIVSEILVAKTAGTIAASSIVLAAIDAATQNSIVVLAERAIAAASTCVLAWIAYKQISFSRKQAAMHATVTKLEENTNGIRSELVLATAVKNKLEGKLEGAAEQKAADISEAALIAKGKLEGSSQVTAPTVTSIPT